jgi:8-oxo-dGTP diphosphatase
MHVTLNTTSGTPFSIDWESWTPQESAVLTFIEEDDQLLLIFKKRGLGSGLYNAPGGRMEPGETELEAAIRETEEELCVTPSNLRKAGILNFAFVDGYSLRCHVFSASSYSGTPTETDEAQPFWCRKDAIPYGRMWADDRIWIPLMLEGRPFTSRFIFDDKVMLWHLLQLPL